MGTAPPHFAGFAGECTATFWQLEEEEEANQNQRTRRQEGEDVPWSLGGKAMSGPHSAQVPSLSLPRTPEPSFFPLSVPWVSPPTPVCPLF